MAPNIEGGIMFGAAAPAHVRKGDSHEWLIVISEKGGFVK